MTPNSGVRFNPGLEILKMLIVTIVRGRVGSLLTVLGLCACSSNTVLHPLPDPSYGYQGGKAISFKTPRGWNPHSGNLGHVISFEPDDCQATNCPLLTVEVFRLNAYQPRTESNQALSYLDGLRQHEDQAARMESTGALVIPPDRRAAVYRFHSAYLHEQLLVFLFEDDLMVQIRLSGTDYAVLKGMVSSMQELAETLTFQ